MDVHIVETVNDFEDKEEVVGRVEVTLRNGIARLRMSDLNDNLTKLFYVMMLRGYRVDDTTATT